jgi:hypothetical protein
LPKAAIAEPAAAQQPSLLKRVQEMLDVHHRLRSDQDLVALRCQRENDRVADRTTVFERA